MERLLSYFKNRLEKSTQQLLIQKRILSQSQDMYDKIYAQHIYSHELEFKRKLTQDACKKLSLKAQREVFLQNLMDSQTMLEFWGAKVFLVITGFHPTPEDKRELLHLN